MRAWILLTFLLFPLAMAWVYPHALTYSTDPYKPVRICATAYSPSDANVTLTCGGDVVGYQFVAANAPTILCFNYVSPKTTECRWSDGVNMETVHIDVFPHALADAILAVLVVVLIVRFTVRLVQVLL